MKPIRRTGQIPAAVVAAAAMCVGAVVARAGEPRIDLDRPGEGEFVRDLADMIDAEDEDRIRTIGQKLLNDKAAPLLVVTIPSMERHLSGGWSGGGDGMRIEMFAQKLFDQWGVGPTEVAGHPWNRGMLLLVSRGDRVARIELGAGWGLAKNGTTLTIMDQQIVPRFRSGDYSGGILAGAQGLDAMARELELPRRSTDWSPVLWVAGGGAIAALVLLSLYRSGTGGWAGATGRLLFELISMLQYTSTGHGGRSRTWGGGYGYGGGASSSRSLWGGSSGRSSFSGSSRTFGGGRSGGGGATGRW